MKEYKAQIYDILCKHSILYDQIPSKEKLQAYTEILSEYPAQALSIAFKEMIKKSDRFPSIKQIIEIIDPAQEGKDKAIEDAGRVFEAIRKFGRLCSGEAREWLGEDIWASVQRYGGWEELCETKIDDRGIAMAQLRDIIHSLNQSKRRNDTRLIKNTTDQKLLSSLLQS